MMLWCEVVCGVCATTTAGRFVSGTVSKMEFSRAARAEGWGYAPLSPENGGYMDWHCPQCLKKHRAEKRAAKKKDQADAHDFEY